MAESGSPGSDRNVMRIVGLLMAGSTPISGLISYAVAAVIVGETRLEGSGGLTGLGWAVVLLPLLFGLGLFAASWFVSRGPSRSAVGLFVGLAAVVVGGLGVRSVASSSGSGDASIGGGLLIITSLIGVATAVLLLRGRGGDRRLAEGRAA